MKKRHDQVTFKPYVMNQAMLLPPTLDEMVPENHFVRVVNDAVERMNIDPLLQKYKGGGTSSYHPKMMLKVLIYAYSQRIYSSRRIAKALRENVHFMWLSGSNRPDFRTINRFRSSTMKGVIDEVFASVVELLIEDGYIKLENYFLDGTKLESSANKYTFVWAKSTLKNKEKMHEKIKLLLDQIDQVNEEENEHYGDHDLEEMGEAGPIDAKRIEEKIKELNERLAKNGRDKNLSKAVKQLQKDFLPRQRRYEEQEALLAGRNSYAKTDPDATFMRMKEDHMLNGQLKPGYNIQMGTEGQFIVGYSVHQKATDTTCLIPHLEHVEQQLGRLPANIVADAGYGSEENYAYLASKGLGNYVKYNTFSMERKRSFKKKAFRVENWPYNPATDEFTCPAGQGLRYIATRSLRTENGYRSELRLYEAENCLGCKLLEQCTKARGNRRIQVNFQLNQFKATASKNLATDEGIKLRAQRGVDVETVFGRIKGNWRYRRFLLKGLEKVTVEWGLLGVAHNLTKMAVLA